MTSYPIHVQRDHYRGRDPRRRERQRRHNEVAQICERYLNEKIATSPANVQTYLYYQVARDLRLPLEEVREVLFSVDGGHNGLTVRKDPGVPI